MEKKFVGLTGTEKQIAWAVDLRSEAYERLSDIIRKEGKEMQEERKLAGAVLELAFRDYVDNEDAENRAYIKRDLIGERGALFCGLCSLSNEDIFPKLDELAAAADQKRRETEAAVLEYIKAFRGGILTRKSIIKDFRARGLKNHETARALVVLSKAKQIRVTGGRVEIRQQEGKKK